MAIEEKESTKDKEKRERKRLRKEARAQKAEQEDLLMLDNKEEEKGGDLIDMQPASTNDMLDIFGS